MSREVLVQGSVLKNRDGTDGAANVGDRVQLVETEKGLRTVNPHDRNAKLVDMKVVNVRTSVIRDPRTGKHVELTHTTLREEGHDG